MESGLYKTFSLVEDQHWWFSARRKFIRRLIERFVVTGPPGGYCEIGCGTGGNLSMLAETGTLDAVEMDAYGLECASARAVPGVRSVSSGFLPDDLPVTGPYRAVFALDVIEHVEADAASVQSMAALLQEGGMLVITVPAYQWMWSYHDELNQHVRRYSRGELLGLVERAGLQVVYSSHLNMILSPMAILARAWEKLLGVFRKPQGSIGMEMPAAWLNRILEAVFSLEQYVAGRVSLPFGLSIVVVATRKSGSD